MIVVKNAIEFIVREDLCSLSLEAQYIIIIKFDVFLNKKPAR